MLAFFHKKFKLLGPIALVILSSLITACGGGSTVVSNSNTNNGTLSISAFSESNLMIGESTTATISIVNSTSGESAIVVLNNNNPAVISLSSNNCTLSTTANSCTVTITAIGTGSATFSASSTGSPTVTSQTLMVSSISALGILFGTENGLVFNNAALIPGLAPLAGVDNSPIAGFAIDSNNNMYVGTQGSSYNNLDSPFGFGAGKVFKYDNSLGYWILLPGNGAGGSLDSSVAIGGSSVNVLVVDSNNNLYAGTNAGNVFKYANNIWSQMGANLGQPIKTLALDASNNLYVGINNGSNTNNGVFKYTNGTFVTLGSPDGTGIQSIAINNSGSIYAATAGYIDNEVDPAVISSYGEVYKYTSGTNWNVISAFNDGTVDGNNVAVNSVVVNGSKLYAGTATGKVHQYSGSGTSWTSLGTPDQDSSPIMTLTLNESDLYAGTKGDGTNGQVYHYTGTTWNQMSNLNNGAISVIVVKNGSIYTSTANDSTGMVYAYAANASWSPIGTGTLDGTQVYSTTISSDGTIYVGTQNNVFKYLASNELWVPLGNINLLDGSGVAALTTYESNVYAGMLSGNIYTTTNGGNWQQLASNSNYITSDLLVNKTGQLYTSMNYNDPNDQIVKDGRVQKYNSTTGVWTTLAGTSPHKSVDGTPILSIAMDESGNVYAATVGSGNGGFVWKYPASGSAWIMLGTGTLDGTSVNSVITDSSLNVYAATSAGNVFKYNGYYWMQINTNPLDAMGVSSLNFDHRGNLYAATYGGMVWEYINNTALWVNTKYGIGVSINVTGSTGF